MELGKADRRLLERTVWRLSGAKSSNVITGPTPGVDVSVLRLGQGRVMIANCDPISLLPELGAKDSAIMSVREVASDVATSGNPPQYAMFDLNLPPRMSDRTLELYWKSISMGCKELGISILGGHTGRFEGCDYSIVGSATVWTTCGREEYLTSEMAGDGDDVILTKTAAYGATAILARSFSHSVRKHLGESLCRKAMEYLQSIGTVGDSLTAVEVGIHNRGVTAIHNVTEGGVLTATMELAAASHLGAIIDLDVVPVSVETSEIAKLFKLDPLLSLGEGSLLIAARPNKTKRILDLLNSRRVKGTVVGQLSSKVRGVYGVTLKGRTRMRLPDRDPYWNAYWRAVRKHWS